MVNQNSAADHFAFGENWKSFVRLVDSRRIEQAETGLARILRREEIEGKSFLDIGCGSGLSSLAAARFGAASIRAFDLDPASVEATRTLLSANVPPGIKYWSADVMDVFELPAGSFDVVYSWGALHHTGDMWCAIRSAATQVKSGGLFAIAIYGKTSLCDFWRHEKAFYSKAPYSIQCSLRGIYKACWICANILTGTNPIAAIRGYSKRGMDWTHDVHDWLGGYPYESATPPDVRNFMESLDFELVRENLQPGKRRGLLGSGCDEYVFRRKSPP